MNFKEELNESQLRAVEYCEGPSLVIAGAGSGKTRVLTYKIAYLIDKGMLPYNILALTFTNKAAKEMRMRIGRLVGEEQARHLWMGTFHSIFARILRTECEKIGYSHNFTIYDESDSHTLIKRILKEKELDEKKYKPTTVEARISKAKNRLITSEKYASSPQITARDEAQEMPELSNIYKTYVARCRQANAMDFDDLLLNTWLLFDTNEDVRQKWASQFRFVLVDEYQDTNYVQHQIVLQLTRENRGVCVVGDDAQSIYSFRGAEIGNILGFSRAYIDARTFKLERNYRSTKSIVEAANSLIKHNEWQIQKEIYSENQEGERLIRKDAYSDKEEAIIVCREIQRLMREEHATYSDFAVLYRTNSQSRQFEDAFRKEGIPYRIFGGLSFYSRKEIKDVIAYFRLAVNPYDDEAFRRVVNYPTRGIGETTIKKIFQCASAYGVSAWEVLIDLERYPIGLSHSTREKVLAFGEMISMFLEDAQTADASQLGNKIIRETGIFADLYSGSDIEDVARQENLQELINGLDDFVATRKEEGNTKHIFLSDYLQEISLLTDVDVTKDLSVAKVDLMTIHSAKGLEFSTVFIVGVEENIFPSPMSLGSLRGLEEERRLFYVAITRAARRCYITTAQNRWRYGKMEFNSPSRFIQDIDSKYLSDSQGSTQTSFLFSKREMGRRVSNSSKSNSYSKVQTNGNTSSSPFMGLKKVMSSSGCSPSKIAQIKTDDIIEHERFGIGRVLHVEGTGENTKATVQFVNAGLKQLLLKFARVKKIR